MIVDTGRSYTAEAASVGAPTLGTASNEDKLRSGPVGCAADIVDDIPVRDERCLNVALKGRSRLVTSTQFSTALTPSISVMRWDAARSHSSDAFRGRLRQVTAPRLGASSGAGYCARIGKPHIRAPSWCAVVAGLGVVTAYP